MLFVLRRVTALQLGFVGNSCASSGRAGEYHVPSTLLDLLCHFSHLQSLEVQGIRIATEESLRAALDSLPSLTNLEINDNYQGEVGWPLTRVLHRLCCTQLIHLTVTSRLLYMLTQPQPDGAMPHVRSLTVVDTTPYWQYTELHVRVFARCFPSLLHLTVSGDSVIRHFAAVPLPPLSSLTLHGATEADMSHINTRTFCVVGFKGCLQYNNRERMRSQLMRAPHLRQLALSTDRVPRTKSDYGCHLFRSGRLVYLEFLVGLALADLADLLSATSPPAFAAHLTHLALRVSGWTELLQPPYCHHCRPSIRL